MLKPTPIVDAIKTVRLPMTHLFQVKHIETNIMYPHELFAAMYNDHYDLFLKSLCGGSLDNIPKFWNALRNHPALVASPATAHPEFQTKCIPISLHGDGVPVAGIGKAWSRSMEILSWSSLLARGNTQSYVFLIFLVHKLLACKSDDRNTMTIVWKHICWSFKWLALGKWPETDVAGQAIHTAKAGTPLADGFHVNLFALLGDRNNVDIHHH